MRRAEQRGRATPASLRRLLTRLPAPSPVARCQRGRSPLAENQIALIPLSRLLACAVLASTMLASACGAKAAPAVQPQSPPLDPTQQLAARIAGMLADPAFEHATWAISIRSLDRHDTLYAVNPHKLVMPASTMKLVTLAAAARQLGWDYAYETTLLATGPVASGALAGDLVIVGSGDPSIDDWDGSASRLFAEWAARLKSAGISHIDGQLIGDDNAFSDTPLGSGWAWDDLSASYATSIGGLQFNENTAQLVITPALRPGQPARIELAPPSAPVSVRNGVGTSSPDVPQALTIRPAPRGPDIDVHGSIPLNAPPQIRNVSVPNPTRYFANALRLALAINGVDIRGETLDVDDLAAPPNAAAARPLVSHRSAPLSTLAATMMKMSQNLYAETLLRTLGASAAHDGSPEGGRAAVLRTLADWGIPATEIVMADGSGLSRYNLITADALTALLSRVHDDDRLRDPFVAALPVASVDGTLAERMKGTTAAANARAKTGSFSNARALAGYVRSAGGETIAFAIVANNYGVAPDVVDRTTDEIVVALSAFAR